ncbi:class I SAM-dependent methyltransferase [Kribbella sp. CA-293567]|uniref:class I SAM-dependent methyltransferase n=1 Tax=Kribbella sp. CA-293567 TaxID=3002436 RepID=UPI0022DCF568|nr:class I SAM-dependent methyltransferase [Kribbella sp. CA-293567]WBQ03892.1 class I SAM-dependent methyltransferase [Kribbella sp. CA-293567]
MGSTGPTTQSTAAAVAGADGGYDEGYAACPCFWGKDPATLVERAATLTDLSSAKVLDIGCGEGKNSYYLASRGADVRAFDVSGLAIEHTKKLWPPLENLRFEVGDLRQVELDGEFDLVLATGSFHCLRDRAEVGDALARMQALTRPGGLNVFSAFNDRSQDLSGHGAHFQPCLLPHEYYVDAYRDWELLHASDTDLADFHPHTEVPHHHSITRLLARRT